MTDLLTPRLELRRWSAEDVPRYARIMRDPEVSRFFGGPVPEEQVWRQVALFIGHRALRGWSQAVVVERETGEFVGRGGLWRPPDWPGLEVGWVLDRSRWGRGYASELGRASRDFAAHVLREPHLISLIAPANAASIRVAEAIGSSLEGEWTIGDTPVLIYGQDLHP
ncbi:GNAT family N-acetyltransferase [uncultured Amnibacterium sp.]|uniref:GNAT family N-acetyltransferase n=1 Tax=uncultured Amnibacterium sp. TaxID=1631851 RepID=UPI0035C9829D